MATKKEVVKKLREIADRLETCKSGSVGKWKDLELEKVSIVGRPTSDGPFAPVFVYDIDFGALFTTPTPEDK